MSATEHNILPGFEEWFQSNQADLEALFNSEVGDWTKEFGGVYPFPFDDVEAFSIEIFIQLKSL